MFLLSPVHQGMFMAMKHVCTKFWPHFAKQNGHHSQLFEKHKDALNPEIFQPASSNLHRRYTAKLAL